MLEILKLIIPDLTRILVAGGGWILVYKLNFHQKKMEQDKNTIIKYKEIRARIYLETITNQWLAELTGKTEQAIKQQVRKKLIKDIK